ncbi:GDSL esterase/lipase At1g28600-like [Phragmites australis]|uniref:GDSL esterase/lipase At1g28600-like n=1 Tax=Phragmites australis TaxID=29695 RepID=UPI002D77BA4C|nr:GDSL esterase/lipase At1g28600-like [Phragmites australis]
MIPAGCTPPILVLFTDADPAGYDPRTGCLKEINELSIHHNSLLLESLHELRARHPDVEIIYADFFSPIMKMVESPAKFGQYQHTVHVPNLHCSSWSGPGRYHHNYVIFCSDADTITCKDPSARLFWDGAHLTEAANRYIAGDWLSSTNQTPTGSSQ